MSSPDRAALDGGSGPCGQMEVSVLDEDFPDGQQGRTDPLESAFGFDGHTDTWLTIARRATAPLIVDQLIGGYELVSEIGRGGQGVVYRAIHAATGRPVALKRLHAPLPQGVPERSRFGREAAALLRLRHPNIVTLFNVDVIDGVPILAMECIDGTPLSAWMIDESCGRPRALAEVVGIVLKVCDAIMHAHQQGIIHCDLKPSNVMIDTDGRPRVLDFGISRLHNTGVPWAPTATSISLAVTPRWAAPEQFRSEPGTIDIRADVYAIGAILYFLLTGREPFAHATTLSDAIRAVERGLTHPPSRFRRGLDPILDAIVVRAMEPDPARRYPNVGALAGDLEAWSRGIVPRGLPIRALQRLRFLLRRRRRALLTLLVTLLIAASAGGALLGWRTTLQRAQSLEAIRLATATAADRLSMRTAISRIRDRDAVGAREQLLGIQPQNRGWEWHALMRRTDDATRVLLVTDRPVESLYFSEGGTQLLVVHDDGSSALVRRDADRSHARDDAAEGGDAPDRLWVMRPGGLLRSLDGGLFPGVSPVPAYGILADDRRRLAWTDAAGLSIGTLTLSTPVSQAPVPGSARLLPAWAVGCSGVGTDRLRLHAFTGALLVTGCDDRTIRVLDVETGEELARRTSTLKPTSVISNPDGTMAALLTFANTVEIVSLPLLETVTILHGHTEIVPRGAVFLPDDEKVVTGSWDSTIRVWTLPDGRLVRTLIGHAGYVRSLSFDGETGLLLSAGYDGTVRAWDPLGEPPHTPAFRTGVRVRRLLTTPDSGGGIAGPPPVLCIGDSSSEFAVPCFRVEMVTPLADTPVGTVASRPFSEAGTGHVAVDYPVALSPGGRLLAVADSPTSLAILRWSDIDRAWSTVRTLEVPVVVPTPQAPWTDTRRRRTSRQSATGPILDRSGIAALAIAHDDQRIVCMLSNGGALLVDIGSGALLAATTTPVEMAFSMLWMDRMRLLVTGEHHAAVLLLTDELDVSASLEVSEKLLTGASVSRDATRVALAHDSGEIVILPANLSGTPLCRIAATVGVPSGLSFSADDRRLAGACSDATVRVWDTTSGELLLTLDDHTLAVVAVTFSPDGHWLISAGLDNMVRYHDGRPVDPSLRQFGISR